MKSKIKVEYEVYSTLFKIKRVIKEIEAKYKQVSFDLETRSIYPKRVRDEAKALLPKANDIYEENELTRIVHSSGLSHPSIIEVTHFIIGLEIDKTIIFICQDPKVERFLFNWLVSTDIKLLIHNSLFDLKIAYHRTGKFPKNYEDTQQLANVLVNDVNDYNRKTGLKHLMKSYYPPRWSIKEETNYEVENLKDKNFLEYCAIDGSATLLLYQQIQEELDNEPD